MRKVSDWTLLEELVGDDSPAMVLYHAVGSPLDKGMRAMFARVAEESGERIRFLTADVNENPCLKERMRVRVQPTVVLYVAGVEVARRVRPGTPFDIQAMIPPGSGDPSEGGQKWGTT